MAALTLTKAETDFIHLMNGAGLSYETTRARQLAEILAAQIKGVVRTYGLLRDICPSPSPSTYPLGELITDQMDDLPQEGVSLVLAYLREPDALPQPQKEAA